MLPAIAAVLLIASAPPAAQPRIALSPSAARNGDVVRIIVYAGRGVTSVSVVAGDRPIDVMSDNGGETWTGLLGIDVEQKPTGLPIVATIERTGTDALTVEATLPVTFRKSPTRRITVPRTFTDPSPEQVERARGEAARLAELFQSGGPPRWKGPVTSPVEAPVTSNFGRRSIVNGQPGSIHAGVDLAAPTGTPIHAPAAGRVVLAEELFYSGNTVVIDHGGQLFSLLAHLSKIDVAEGEMVERGALVGKVGATGRVTGPHLHWTVRLTGARVNPTALIAATTATRAKPRR